jgi:hypothetical protein
MQLTPSQLFSIMKTDKITKSAQKEFLQRMLSTNERWAKSALLKIYDNQTEDEQQAESTSQLNGIGFTGSDGQILSSFAKQLNTKQYLSVRQVEILMPKMKKYWKQILTISDVEKLNEQIQKAA